MYYGRSPVIRRKVGSTKKPVEATLDGYDLTDCSVKYVAWRNGSSVPLFEIPCTVVSAADGTVSFTFSAANLHRNNAGTHSSEFVVAFSDGTVDKLPDDDVIVLEIVPTPTTTVSAASSASRTFSSQFSSQFGG